MTGGILTIIRRCLFKSLWFKREISQYKTLSKKISHARILINDTYEFIITHNKEIFPEGKIISYKLDEILAKNSYEVIKTLGSLS